MVRVSRGQNTLPLSPVTALYPSSSDPLRPLEEARKRAKVKKSTKTSKSLDFDNVVTYLQVALDKRDGVAEFKANFGRTLQNPEIPRFWRFATDFLKEYNGKKIPNVAVGICLYLFSHLNANSCRRTRYRS